MAATSTQLDASCSSSSPYRCTYHAFLSFRGKDTRKGFTDHLYRALELAGIHTFRDDDEIERGANIAAELQRAIQESRVSVIVLSKDYASSRWCLDELAQIMERRKDDHAHVVMPVFYDVDPSHVRKQTGSLAEAFARHEERFKAEMEKVEQWRRALTDVADLGGMVLGQRYESQFIQDIVEEIRSKLDRKVLSIAPYAIGIDDRVRGINMWLEDGSNDVGVAVISGMGGIGKTTIAKAAYNLNFHRFQGSSFLADIRETSEQRNGLVRLQRNLLSDIQKRKTKKIYNIDEGMRNIKDAVCCKKVLIVLDDVNHSDQFNAIIGMRGWFFPGSKIVLTTRYEHLLKAHEVNTMFKVRELDEYESLELFSWHAFGQSHPTEAYTDLSRPVVKHCGGVPLALQVLGSSLSGRNTDIWQSALQKLCEIPDGEIQKILRISYDSLQDDHDKILFLHIACFFRGKDKDFSITVLDNLNFYTMFGIQNLVDRCLVKINEDNKLTVHHLLRDMARGIIRNESPENPGKRSRVWHKDAFNVLRKMTGTETVKGLMLDLSMLMQDESSRTLFNGSNSKRRHVDDYDGNSSGRRRLGLFSWQSFSFSSSNTTPASDEGNLKTVAFKTMHNLEVLLLNNVKFSRGFEDFPKKMIWLSWRGFSLNSIPASLYLRTLVVLDLRNSSLQCVWKGTKFLPSLKILNLSHSHGLTTTPDLAGLPNLERLILKNCKNLVEVDESIGDLEKLVFLNLKDCINLMKLPTRIKMSCSLHKLILSGCSKLVHHPNTVGTNQLHTTATDMKKADSLSANLWKSILSWTSPRKNIMSTSFSVSNLPRSLGSLSLADCNLLEIPGDLSILSSLKYLDLCGNPIQSLPENMRSLIQLETLLLEDCTKLRALPELPPSLQSLRASYCTSLKRITNLPNWFKSLDTDVLDCKKLVEVPSLFNIKPLSSADLEMIKDMGLFNIESIESSSNEVEMINYFTNTTKKVPLQVLSECGIFSIFLNGSKIPDWFSYRSMGKSVLSIIVPSHAFLRIRGLNACVVYSRRPDIGRSAKLQNLLKVSNETKGLMWTYSPITIGVPKENEDMLWLSHLRFGEDELGGRDEVRVSVEFGSELGINLNLFTKEFGIQLVYEQENSEGREKHNVIAGDVSVSSSRYQLWTGKYFLCNNLNRDLRTQLRNNQENPSHLYSDGNKSQFRFLFKHDDISQADPS